MNGATEEVDAALAALVDLLAEIAREEAELGPKRDQPAPTEANRGEPRSRQR